MSTRTRSSRRCRQTERSNREAIAIEHEERNCASRGYRLFSIAVIVVVVVVVVLVVVVLVVVVVVLVVVDVSSPTGA